LSAVIYVERQSIPTKFDIFSTYSEQNKAEEVDFSQYLRISRTRGCGLQAIAHGVLLPQGKLVFL
jgi:hypothetical protein